MAIEMHPNDISRKMNAGIGVFLGRNVVLLIVGVMAFVALMRILTLLYIDWFIAIPLSVLPLSFITLFVWLTRGKPQSWISDLAWMHIWKTKEWMYLSGCMDRAPVLWAVESKPQHPSLF